MIKRSVEITLPDMCFECPCFSSWDDAYGYTVRMCHGEVFPNMATDNGRIFNPITIISRGFKGCLFHEEEV